MLIVVHCLYCITLTFMNAYGSQLWCFNDYKSVERFYVAWRKTIRRIWRIDKRTHNVLTNIINGFLPINLMLEKRCIKFIWNFFNSTHELHKAVAFNCFYNQGSTLAENIRYFMYKYNILIDDWHRPLSYLVRKVYKNDDFLSISIIRV